MITINKRIKKKRIKDRYNYGIELLSGYCELPKEIIINEVGIDLWDVASDLNELNYDLIPYLDSISIDLMWKYGTGWAGKDSLSN